MHGFQPGTIGGILVFCTHRNENKVLRSFSKSWAAPYDLSAMPIGTQDAHFSINSASGVPRSVVDSESTKMQIFVLRVFVCGWLVCDEISFVRSVFCGMVADYVVCVSLVIEFIPKRPSWNSLMCPPRVVCCLVVLFSHIRLQTRMNEALCVSKHPISDLRSDIL